MMGEGDEAGRGLRLYPNATSPHNHHHRIPTWQQLTGAAP